MDSSNVLFNLLVVIIVIIIFIFITQYLWNYVMPDIFGVQKISLIQTLALLILVHIFFGSHYVPIYTTMPVYTTTTV